MLSLSCAATATLALLEARPVPHEHLAGQRQDDEQLERGERAQPIRVERAHALSVSLLVKSRPLKRVSTLT